MSSVASSPNHGGGGEVIELNPFGRIQILYSLSDTFASCRHTVFMCLNL